MLKRFLCVAVVPALVLCGCGNPADDKPEAQVGKAATGKPQPVRGHAYVFSDDSKIQFVGSKVTGSHNGGFNEFVGQFNLVDNDPSKSSVEVTIDATSLWADNERLTGHLKSPDFFDVEAHPSIHFTSTAITPEGEGYKVTGNLQLHGVTKSITFPATIHADADRITAQAEFFIQRFDFDIAFKGKADDLIRDEVVIKLNLVATPGPDAS